MKIFLIAAAAIALGGCASPSATHHQGGPHDPSTRYHRQMKTMRDMHQKMAAAKTLEERQALMAEHMQAMRGGMSMMCETSTTGTGTQGSGMADMTKRCMDMRDMTMKMMLDREAQKPPAR